MISRVDNPSLVLRANTGFRALVCAHTADHHHVQGRVELPVAAAVQPMSLGLSAGGRVRAGAAHHGEVRFALQPFRVVTCRHDEGAGVLDTNAFQVDEAVPASSPTERLDHRVERGDLVAEAENAPCQRLECNARCDGGVPPSPHVWTGAGACPDQLHAGQMAQGLAHLVWRSQDGVAKLLERGAPTFDR